MFGQGVFLELLEVEGGVSKECLVVELVHDLATGSEEGLRGGGVDHVQVVLLGQTEGIGQGLETVGLGDETLCRLLDYFLEGA